MSIDPASGLISGTPTVAGVFVVQLTVSNPHGSVGATLTITLAYAPVITSPTAVTAVAGLPFFYQVTATNNPTSFDFGNTLVDLYGLAYNRSTGLLSGVLTGSGQVIFALSASNGVATGHATLTLGIVYDASPYILGAFASGVGGSESTTARSAADSCTA